MGKALMGRLKATELTVDDAVLRLLIVRQLALLNALDAAAMRPDTPSPCPLTCSATEPAHAWSESSNDVTAQTDGDAPPETQAPDFRKDRLPEPVNAARAHPRGRR